MTNEEKGEGGVVDQASMIAQLKQASDASEMLAAVVAKYFRSLIENGLSHGDAVFFASELQQDIMRNSRDAA